jgi:transposase
LYLQFIERRFQDTTMPRRKPETDKQIALRQGGTLNPRPQDVHHPMFQDSDFFDPDDMVQVKYEMLRQVHVDSQPVSQAAREFGFSRPSFYQANSSFAKAGLAGLAPLKRGPKGGHKLTPEVMEFIAANQKAEPSLSFAQLAELAKKEFDVQVHPRSIERQLLREKKRR